MTSFEHIANEKWKAAQQLTGIYFDSGKQEGSEYLFKNPFTNSSSYGSFRFIPDKQIFMDMTQSGNEMHVTPEKFISRKLSVADREAWELIKKALGKWVDSKQYGPQKQNHVQKQPEKEPFSFIKGTLNPLYLNRTELCTCLIKELEQHRSYQQNFPESIISFFQKRFIDIEHASKYTEVFQYYNAAIFSAFRKKYTDNVLISTGLMRNSTSFYWIGSEYALLFPCWYLNETRWFVTGIRARYTGAQEEVEAKEVEIPLPESLKKLNFPSAVGWYGLKYWSQIYPEVLNQCENLNVIIVEGVMDMLAAMEIIMADKTIILTTGILSRTFHSINIELIAKCKVMFIAFDDDFSAKKNTGQCSASALKAHLNELGMQQVEIFPKKFYQGQKDFNDLLRFIKKDHLGNGL